MPGLRLLLRAAPFLVGVVAASVWLRRRARHRALLEAPREPALLPAEAAERAPGNRFERAPVDIVTVVDDLLDIGR